MSPDVPLTTVVIALHAKADDIAYLLELLGLNVETIARREINWNHVRESDDQVTLIFGRGGLKRVCANRLIGELLRAGFHYTGCELVLKRAVYTKTDVRRSPDFRGPDFREGALKLDKDGEPAYKRYIEIRFTTEAAGHSIAPVKLEGFLEHFVWKRARALLVRDADGARGAIIELVMPDVMRQNRVINELTFHPERGFESFITNSP